MSRGIPRTQRCVVANRGRRGFVKPFKPSGGWSGVVIPQVGIPGNNKILLAQVIPTAGSPTLTIRRIRMSVLFSSDQAAATESPIGAIGAAVLNDTAIAVGVASLPDPVTDIQDDTWMMFQGLHSKVVTAGTLGFTESGNLFEIDSKAMRKLPEGMSLAFIAAVGSAQGASIQAVIRVYTTQARA